MKAAVAPRTYGWLLRTLVHAALSEQQEILNDLSGKKTNIVSVRCYNERWLYPSILYHGLAHSSVGYIEFEKRVKNKWIDIVLNDSYEGPEKALCELKGPCRTKLRSDLRDKIEDDMRKLEKVLPHRQAASGVVIGIGYGTPAEIVNWEKADWSTIVAGNPVWRALERGALIPLRNGEVCKTYAFERLPTGP